VVSAQPRWGNDLRRCNNILAQVAGIAEIDQRAVPANRFQANDAKEGVNQEDQNMSVAKVTEITAASKQGIEDAIATGIKRANETLDNIEGAWVQQITLKCDGGKIVEWRVNMKVTFVLKK
jgi:dodecin